MMNTKILNRKQGKAVPGWQQIEVVGEHPAMLGKTKVVQVIDAAALGSMVAAHKREAAELLGISFSTFRPA